MNRFRPIFLLAICIFLNSYLKADDILIPFGSNLGGAPAWKFKGGGTNLNGIAWKDLGYIESGWVTGNAALGFGVNPPVRNTAIPENSSAGGGGISGARYPTLYFRKTINIPDPGAYAAFFIRAKFDDGIVIWVNGVEAFRNNINQNPVYTDLAPVAITNNGADIYSNTIGSTLFVAGDNIIAVEIHQNTLTSSDLFFDMELTGLSTLTAALTRGPYLQMGNQTSITIRWKTDIATDSRIRWGTSFGSYPNSVDDATFTTEHIVSISGLSPDTKYFYSIGSTSQILQATNTNYLLTMPLSNTIRKLRFAAFGDCGNNSTNQVDSKNALLSYIGNNDLDAVITLGDNAYSSGLDNEFQTNFFDVYKNDLLKNKKLFTSPGNHDYGNSSANTGVRNNAYYNSFSLPANAECGGLASGTKAYYSFDIGDVHFVSLDSYGKENVNTTKVYDTLGAQALWVKNDLNANTKKWTIVYFHHPPYTKTSHDSDAESTDLGAMRENFIRILERYGVDLVLCGHSHGYERSYLLKNYYKANAGDPSVLENNFNFATHTATGNNRNGLYNGTANSCAYNYNSGKFNHGSVYVVAGSAGQIGGTSTGYPHNAMFYSNVSNGGTLYLEVDSNRLNAKFVSYNGTGGSMVPFLRDSFTIFKDVNKVNDIVITKNTPLILNASWRGNYVWPNNGSATTRSVNINTSVEGTYDYTVRDANNCLKDSFRVIITVPVAVNLNAFTASLKKDIVSLEWSTAQEINNHFFSIEKSSDGISFNRLANINAVGNSSILSNYHINDMQPVDGFNYYRLSQTDIDGNRKNLEVKKIYYKGSKEFKTSVVNAGQGIVNIAIQNAGPGMVSVKVIDIMGRDILLKTKHTDSGNANQQIQLQKGIYVLIITNANGKTISKKLLVN